MPTDDLAGDPGAPMALGNLDRILAKADHLITKAGVKIPGLARVFRHYPVSARSLALLAIGGGLLLILPRAVEAMLVRCGRTELNFRGMRIPQSYGLVIVLWCSAWFAAMAVLFPDTRVECCTWMIALGGFAGLGLADDLWGDKNIKGLGGHLRAALKNHRITSGFVKALGGTILALFIGHRLAPGSPFRALLAASVIALSANGINLLDLRPGRAGAVFLGVATLLAFRRHIAVPGALPPILFVAIPTLVVWERDARAKVMMGDAGSNPLGAALGIAVAEMSTVAQFLALATLVALHLVAERASLTTLIERNAILRRLDRLTGAR